MQSLSTVIRAGECGSFALILGRTRYLTFEEEARLFEKLESQEWVQRIVMMAINTGMRQGEIFDLTWFDVDLS